MSQPDTTNGRFRLARKLVLAWAAFCIVLGATATWQTLQLREGAQALDGAGRGLQRTASSLDKLKDLPILGDQAATAAESVDQAGAEARKSGADMRSTIYVLAVLVGLAIAVLPTAPLLLVLWLTDPAARHGRAP